MSEVSWETFLAYPDGDDKFSESWLLSPTNVVSLFPDGGAYCRLCDSYFAGPPAEHVTGHETSLHAWREQQSRNGKVSDSDIKEKLDKAVMLLGEGLSQRQAAATVGIPRSNLQRRLQGLVAGQDSRVAHAPPRVIPIPGLGPAEMGERSGLGGEPDRLSQGRG
jgi:hypothetical protein